jgi:ribosomal protein L11 methylase PrmA
MEAEEQHWQVLCWVCQDYTSSTATYSTETQERKQYMTFKVAQQHIQKQKQHITSSMEADTQEWQKAWKQTLKNIGILAQAWHYNQSAHHFLPCFILHRSFTVISSHFQEAKKHLSKAIDTTLPSSYGTHSRGHTRAVWESCVKPLFCWF